MCKKLRNMVKNKKKGFTLVELLVVIAIIIVLMAIMIPMLSKYLEDANKATDKANARAVYSAAAAWAANEMSENGKVEKVAIGITELKAYFGNPGEATISASLKEDGTVISATYQKKGRNPITYPKEEKKD